MLSKFEYTEHAHHWRSGSFSRMRTDNIRLCTRVVVFDVVENLIDNLSEI